MLYMDALDKARRRLRNYTAKYEIMQVAVDLSTDEYWVVCASSNFAKCKAAIWRSLDGKVNVLPSKREDKIPEDAYMLYANGHWY